MKKAYVALDVNSKFLGASELLPEVEAMNPYKIVESRFKVNEDGSCSLLDIELKDGFIIIH